MRDAAYLGVSLGGATTIRAAARDPRVKAVVDDCGFSDAPGMISLKIPLPHAARERCPVPGILVRSRGPVVGGQVGRSSASFGRMEVEAAQRARLHAEAQGQRPDTENHPNRDQRGQRLVHASRPRQGAEPSCCARVVLVMPDTGLSVSASRFSLSPIALSCSVILGASAAR
jgi:pimeloyl-ACP methyl ester carboxylesterase